MHGDTTLPFIVCAGLGALLNAIPLPKAIASGNVGTSMLIVWTGLACLVQFANAIRWNGNIKDWAPSWCDFCGRFIIAADVGLVGAGVSINRRIYMILTLDPRRRQKVLNATVDIVFCLVIPLVAIALEYVVQQYRYYIFEDIGCVPGVGSFDLAFPLVWMLPLLIGSVSAGYACRTIRVSLQRNRGEMGKQGQNLAWSGRLMSIAALSLLYGLVPTSIAIVLMATAYPVTSWPGWKAVHSTINVVVYVSAREWHTNSIQIGSAELRRWTIVSLAFVIFLYFGLTSDMKKIYCAPFRGAAGRSISIGQARATPDQTTHETFNNRWEGSSHDFCAFPEETLPERRPGSQALSEGLGLDANPESIELALPLAVTHSTSLQKLDR